jgi:hypothetical protein
MQETQWDIFCRTGKIEDYLSFKAAAKQAAETKKEEAVCTSQKQV